MSCLVVDTKVDTILQSAHKHCTLHQKLMGSNPLNSVFLQNQQLCSLWSQRCMVADFLCLFVGLYSLYFRLKNMNKRHSS